VIASVAGREAGRAFKAFLALSAHHRSMACGQTA
jgi:hypothetical protein